MKYWRFVGAVLLGGSAFAENTFVDYKARLTDAFSGQPITTPTQIDFRICRGGNPSGGGTCGGGTSLLLETVTVTPDANGIFERKIGSVTPLDTSLLDTQTPLYLELTIAGQTVGRRKLLSLGTDLANAGGVSIESIAAVASRGFNVETGALRISVPSSSTGSAVFWLAQNNVPSSKGAWAVAARSGAAGTAGHLGFFNLGTPANDVLDLFPTTGNVGIGTGTNDPGFKLSVAGDIKANGSLVATNGLTVTAFGQVINSAGHWVGDPTGLQGPPGPPGPPGPAVSTSAVCDGGLSCSPSTQCSTLCITAANQVGWACAPCTVTSDTGSCSITQNNGTCCVCKP